MYSHRAGKAHFHLCFRCYRSRLVRTMSSAQIMAIHFLVATFFFVCHIPNVIIEHWAFVMLIRGLAPEYASHMFKRDALSSTWLSKLHEETEERTEDRFESEPGDATMIIDGFKDRRRRHVMNITKAKLGIPVYLSTVWFGTRRHTGDVYGAELERIVGDGSGVIAAVADNTGSMVSMRRGLFGWLSVKFPCWFLLGCFVHCWDLLAEDVGKIDEIQVIVEDFRFIVTFIYRYSMIHEAFLLYQKRRRESDPSTHRVRPKISRISQRESRRTRPPSLRRFRF